MLATKKWQSGVNAACSSNNDSARDVVRHRQTPLFCAAQLDGEGSSPYIPPMAGKTLYDKIWDAHVVSTDDNGESILYIDLHLIHEVTTPQAFAGLRAAHRGVRRPERTLAVADHNVPTEGQALGVGAVADEEARLQLQTLERNVATTASSSSRWAICATASCTWSAPSRGAPSPA